MVGGKRYLLPEILGQTDLVGAKTAIFNRYSLVAPQPSHVAKKSSVNTNRKSTARFPMSIRWTSYIAPKLPKGGSKTQCPKFKKIICDNCETVRDIMSVSINH